MGIIAVAPAIVGKTSSRNAPAFRIGSLWVATPTTCYNVRQNLTQGCAREIAEEPTAFVQNVNGLGQVERNGRF